MIAADQRPPAEAEEQPLLSAGDVVGGRYVLTRVVGRGAAGTVWEAEHRLLTSRVAVKFLDTAALLDPTSAEILAQRFRFEAQISARLANGTKHLVAAHDAGMFRGIPYLVMELVDGETLDARLTRGALPLEEAVHMVEQLAEPIDAAHSFGIAHRDIKPGNVMILPTPSGPFYKLGDFGTAKAFGEGLVGLTPPKQTSENTLVGSPAYMSPEYISGLPLANGAIDVWALSVTMYEALTGKLPFDGEVWTQVAVAIVGGEFAKPSSVVPELPAAVDDVFAKAFSQETEERYTSARELAKAFRAAITPAAEAPKPAPIEVATPLDEPLEIPKRDGRVWAYAIGAFVFVLAVTGIAIVATRKAPEPTREAAAATTPTAVASAPVETATQTQPTAAPPPVETSAPTSAASAASASASAAPTPIKRRPPIKSRGPVDKSEIH